MTSKIKVPTLAEAGTAFSKWWGILVIVYGIVVSVQKKNDKIENAVTQKQLIEVVTEFNTRLADVTNQLEETNKSLVVTISNQEITNKNTQQVNDNFVTIKEEFAAHIRKSKDIPPDQRLDDILSVVQGIHADLQQLKVWPDVKINIEKNDKKKNN
jgi:hypothetical protein